MHPRTSLTICVTCVCSAGSPPLFLRFSLVAISASAKDVKVAVSLALAAAAAVQVATVHGKRTSVLCVALRSAGLSGFSAADSVKQEAA